MPPPLQFDFSGIHWTPARKKLYDWLSSQSNNSHGLAELYHGCIVCFYEAQLPGRGLYVCHAVREIRNRLPDIVSKTAGGARLDYTAEVEKVAAEWRKEYPQKIFKDLNATDTTPNTDSKSISDPLFHKINNLIAKHEFAGDKPKEKVKKLFNITESDIQKLPLIPLWSKTGDWFADQAHFSGLSDNEYDWEKMLKNFELLE